MADRPAALLARQGQPLVVTVTMSPVVDVAAWTITCVVNSSSGAAKLTLTVGSGITLGSPTTSGTFTVTFSIVNLATLEDGTVYQYSIDRTNAGSEGQLAYGSFVVLAAGATEDAPFSFQGSYATPLDLINTHDENKIGDWASTSKARLTTAQILTDPVVAANLLRAAGEVEAYCTRGKRYTPDDLALLDGNSRSLLVGLVCDLAFYHLAKRRIPKPEEVAGYESATKMLDRLEKGEAIFGMEEAADAGAGPSTADLQFDSRGRMKRMTERFNRIFLPKRADNRRDGN